jgi:centriolar protein POC1
MAPSFSQLQTIKHSR